ncbi:MAG: ribonuclease D [Saprospiraceae bacterium]
MKYTIHHLDDQEHFDEVMKSVQDIDWIGFDTEFIGEKTYIPKLCLLQIICNSEIYLVDTLEVKNLDLFLDFIEDPKVLKVTHAGDNDYRLLYQLFGTVPKNTFDTQVAAGFVGYNYPAGFRKIVERELRISLSKSHTVTNWEIRPLPSKAVDYAVEDVKYLPQLHEQLAADLEKRNRTSWAREENRKWEEESFYQLDPYKEVLNNDLIYQLDFKHKVFLLRLITWRRETAASLNVPKDAVLQSRHISTVVKSIKNGQQGFRANRTLPENVWKRHQNAWIKLQEEPVRDEEKAFIKSLPAPGPDNPETEWAMELLYHFVRKQCLEHEISAALLLPRGDFNKLKSGNGFDETLLTGWRAEMLGPTLVKWLKAGKPIQVAWTEDSCKIEMK